MIPVTVYREHIMEERSSTIVGGQYSGDMNERGE